MTEQLREKIGELLVEPDIGYMDWELGKTILANWKVGLPHQILTIIKDAGWQPPKNLTNFPKGATLK